MSTVHTKIILKNVLDVGNAENGIIKGQIGVRNKLGLRKIGTNR